MSAAVAPVEITEPGVYDLPFDVYLADPVPGGSLSTSGAKTLLNACPAIFDYERTHGRPDKAAFDVGHAAHSEVLGSGVEIAVIPDDTLSANGSTNTKAAQAFIAEARLRGAVPIKSDVAADVKAMAAALRAHPIAGKLLDPDRGTPEQSLFWTDERTGVWRRARLDALPHPAVGRMIIADYKSCVSAHPRACEKAIANYGYNMQGAAYCDAVKAVGLAEDAALLLIFQETSAPYLISVVEMTANNLRIGAERNARAIDIFKRCTETNHWPAYVEGIELVDAPFWAERQHEEEMAS
jgi:hypothetical protein